MPELEHAQAHGITVWGQKAWPRETWIYSASGLLSALKAKEVSSPIPQHYNDTCILLWHLDLQIW